MYKKTVFPQGLGLVQLVVTEGFFWGEGLVKTGSLCHNQPVIINCLAMSAQVDRVSSDQFEEILKMLFRCFWTFQTQGQIWYAFASSAPQPEPNMKWVLSEWWVSGWPGVHVSRGSGLLLLASTNSMRTYVEEKSSFFLNAFPRSWII